jgi:hypothetical protein
MAHVDSTAPEARILGLVNHPGYLVGDDGSVWSRRRDGRQCGATRQYGELRRLGGHRLRSGHIVASLGRGNHNVRYIHRLVLESFSGPCPEGMECRHLDGDPSNNRLGNLAWGTRVENMADKARHGTQPRGARVHNARLNDGVIPIIRDAYSRGVTQDQIARVFGVTTMTIWHVVNGRTWTHVG